MKQILQSYKTGELWLAEVPCPACGSAGVVVRNSVSFVSAGTERMLVDFAKKNLVGKALAMPDQVKKVLRKMKTEGIFSTLEKVQAKLDQPIPLGYSCAGVVEEVGIHVSGLAAGDRVACGGAGYANHAEYNYVPKNLVVRIPAGVSDEDASCTTVGSIALQGVRQAELRLGESCAVIGLGLLGLLAVQILKASGVRVIGFDPDGSKTRLALELGADVVAEDGRRMAEICREMTNGNGVDAVLITAATQSNEPVALAGDLCRVRGKVVVTGMVGMDIPRDQYYKKELDFKLSLSCGPGRYDTSYEEGGHDYPYGYVRWTEQRNMQAFLDLAAEGKVTPSKLITHRFAFEDALDAYQLMLGGKEPYLGIVLNYHPQITQKEDVSRKDAKAQRDPQIGQNGRRVELKASAISHQPSAITIGFIGAGNFAKGVLLPELRKMDRVRLKGICTATGMNAVEIGKKEGFEFATTDYGEILRDSDIDTVFVATRHDSHARFVCEALRAGKHVFVEKPLCLNQGELAEIEKVRKSEGEKAERDPQIPQIHADGKIPAQRLNGSTAQQLLMVGFNRRFSPLIRKMKEVVGARPMIISYRINAGVIPRDVWIQDLEVGGGRIVGEVCHFVDTVSYLSGSAPKTVYAACVHKGDQSIPDEDNVSVVIGFENESVANICYTAYGSARVPKEFVEVSSGEMTLRMDDFRELTIFRGNRKEKMKVRGQDKGFQGELAAFLEGIKTGVSPILFESLAMTTRVTFAVHQSLKSQRSVEL